MGVTKRRLRMKIRIEAEPTKIFDAITNPLKLSIWFCNKGEVSLKVRGAVRMSGENCAATTFREKEIVGSITELDPNRLVKFTWPINGTQSEVTWQIDEKRNFCDFLVTHDKIPENSMMMDAWLIYLYNLQSLLHVNRPSYRLDYARLDRGTIRRELFIEALPPAIFKALTDQRDLRVWFSAQAEVDPQVGGKYLTGWKDSAGNPDGSLEIVELIENKKLSYNWHYSGGPSGDLVTWELLRIGEKTRVTVKHSGFAAETDTKGFTQGWHAFILGLKDFCETRGRMSYTIIDGDWSA